MESFTDEEISHWILQDFAESRGILDDHEEIIERETPNRRGFDYRLLKNDLRSHPELICTLMHAFSRKHTGQLSHDEFILPPKGQSQSDEEYTALIYRKTVRALLQMLHRLA